MGYKQYCKEPEKIENYQLAKKDNFKGWHCHHRLETHTPDGKRRDVDIPQKELIALGMYYNRPASELVFLTSREHNAFRRGRKRSDETRRRMSEAGKGNKNALGCKRSEETKNKIREANKGKELSDETRRRIGAANKGNKHALGCKRSEETKKKMSEAKKNMTAETRRRIGAAKKGMHFFNNGKINIRAKECPPGFVPGRLK